MRPTPFLFLLCFWLLAPKVTATITHQAQEDLSIKVLQHLPYPQGRKTSRTYNAAGELSLITYPDGSTEEFERDNMGRPTRITYTPSAGGGGRPAPVAGSSSALPTILQMSYNQAGDLTRIQSGERSVLMQYDLLGRLTSREIPFLSRRVEYEWDAASQLTERREIDTASQNTRTVKYTYSARGEVTRIEDGDTITEMTYTPGGKLLTRTYPGGILLTQSYNEFGELSSQVWTNPLAGNALLHQLHYDYDANGRMISRMDDQGITTLRYDAQGRLIESTLPNGDKEEFVFNSAGYLQSKVSVTKRVDMTYNASGQITRVLEYIPPASFPSVANEYTWQWNADGTLKSIENQSTQTATYYLWNARKKLEGVAFSNGSTSTAYAYFPGSDLRFASVGKEGILTYYQWEGVQLREISNDPTGMTGPPPTSSGGRLLDAPTDSRPATPKASAYLAGMPGTWDEVLTISIPKANSAQDRVMAIFQNHQQSVVATAEKTQPHITQNIFDYLAYGEPLGFEAAALPNGIGYTGRQHDQGTGLLYYRGRYFNQCTGSFIQEDPMRDGLNWYAYSNDPGNTVDPSGYRTEINEFTGDVLDVVLDGTTDIYAAPFRNGERLQGPKQLVGNSFDEDSFLRPRDDGKTGTPVGKVHVGSTIDDYIQNQLDKDYGYVRTWYESTSGGEFDMKLDPSLGGPYAGHKFRGKYMTTREAGNMLAGMNAARLGMDFEDFQKGAGPKGVLSYKISGTTYGKPPEYGEIPYQHKRSRYGYDLYNSC